MKIGAVTLSMVTTESNYRRELISMGSAKRTLGHKLIKTNHDKAFRWDLECYALDSLDSLQAAHDSGEPILFEDRDGRTYSVLILAITDRGCIDQALSKVQITLETVYNV